MRGQLARAALVVGMVGSVVSSLISAPPAAALSCGPCPASTTDRLNLREGPSLSDDVLLVIPNGAELRWDPAQDRTNGFVAVIYDDVKGWAYAAYLRLFPMTGTTTDRLNLREDPSLSAPVITVMPADSTLGVLSGPVDGFYSVRYDQQIAGWASEDYISFGGGSGEFSIGDDVVVNTDALNLRAGPGLGRDVRAVLLDGADLEITDGPENADGYAWYEVDAGSRGTGWVAGAFLAEA